ncbi:RHS repeat-associated core domain-containing protein [Pseudomonas gingeri]
MEALKIMGKKIGIALLALTMTNAALADTVTYFHNDISGSPLAATDAAGNLLWKENYKPYGDKLNRSASSNENKMGFHGKPYDDATGLSYMGARYYDPVLGRFMGIDPVGFQEKNLHSFNRYTYANNNPYKYVDPDGHYAFLVAPIFALFTALAATATVKSVLNGGRQSGSNEFNAGGMSYPGSDAGNPTNWSLGQVHNEQDTKKSEGASGDDASTSKSEKPARGRPWTGEPGSTSKQTAGGDSRRYGNDGYPEVDYDAPHPDEAYPGNAPHAHNWGRPQDGGPPTHKDRGYGSPYSPLPRGE